MGIFVECNTVNMPYKVTTTWESYARIKKEAVFLRGTLNSILLSNVT